MKKIELSSPESDGGFAPVEGETTAAMIARLRADPAVMAIYRKRYPAAAIGSGLREAREACGLTQEQVATKLSTTKSAVCRLESPGSHQPSMRQVARYAEAIGAELHFEIHLKHETMAKQA